MDHGESANIALRMVRDADVLCVDVETTGVYWTDSFVVGWALSDGKDAVYVPLRHGGGGNLPGSPTPDCRDDLNCMTHQHEFEKRLAAAIAKRDDVIIGHNLKFDCHFAANHGVMLGRNLSCTMNRQALIDEYSPSFTLESVAKSHGVRPKMGEQMRSYLCDKFGIDMKAAMGEYWRLPGTDAMAQEYAIGDGLTTVALYHAQEKELDRQGIGKEVRELEDALLWTLFRMERKGVAIDFERVAEVEKLIEARVAAAYDRLPDGFNPRSPRHVMDYVSQYRTDWPLTEKGNPSFTELWLRSFPEGDPIVILRKWTNVRNTFLTPLKERHASGGRVHTIFNQNRADDYGTVSGRLSSSNPNMQQVPKHDKEIARLFRSIFVPDEGRLMYEADYSQCEPRLFAHYSGDDKLVAGYNKDPCEDVHDIVARLFDRDRGTVAKRMNMGMFTGMYPRAFADHMGITQSEATELWNRWRGLFPKVPEFQERAKHVMLQRGFVRTLLGRHCRMESTRLAYKAVSRIIQGSNADIMKYKLVEMDRWCEDNEGADLLLSVHDSCVWQTTDDEAGREAARALTAIMADVSGPPFNLRVPFAVDCSHGRNWAEATFGEEK